MLYTVRIDMSKMRKELNQHKISVHSKTFTVVYVEADSPDDACASAIRKVCSDIAIDKSSANNRQLAKKASGIISVTAVRKKNSGGKK